VTMVHVSLSPHHGNHLRFFPFAGYLGLTPVVVQGRVRTSLEADRKSVRARSLCVRVRCYEADTSPAAGASATLKPSTATGTSSSGASTSAHIPTRSAVHVLYEASQEVWRASESDSTAYGDLGELSSAFRIVLPVDAVGPSTMQFRHWKVWWQVEAVILQEPTSFFGAEQKSSWPLPLIRHAPPSSPTPLRWTRDVDVAEHPRHSVTGVPLNYAIHTDSTAYGPGEPLRLAFEYEKLDPRVNVRKVSASIDRVVTVDSSSSSSTVVLSPSHQDIELDSSSSGGSDDSASSDDEATLAERDPPPSRRQGRSTCSRTGGLFKRAASVTPSYRPRRPIAAGSASAATTPPAWHGGSTVDSKLSPGAMSEPSGPASYFSPRAFVSGGNGKAAAAGSSTYAGTQLCAAEADAAASSGGMQGTLTLATEVPQARSIYRYSHGESCRTQFATVKFLLTVKIALSRARGGSVETYTLPPHEIEIMSVSAQDRAAVLQHAGRALALADAEQRFFLASLRGSGSDEKTASSSTSGSSKLGVRRSSEQLEPSAKNSRRTRVRHASVALDQLDIAQHLQLSPGPSPRGGASTRALSSSPPMTRSMPLSARPSPELAYVGEEEDGQHHNAPPSLPALSTTSSSPEPDFVASRRHSRHQSARVFPSGPSRRSMMGSAELGLSWQPTSPPHTPCDTDLEDSPHPSPDPPTAASGLFTPGFSMRAPPVQEDPQAQVIDEVEYDDEARITIAPWIIDDVAPRDKPRPALGSRRTSIAAMSLDKPGWDSEEKRLPALSYLPTPPDESPSPLDQSPSSSKADLPSTTHTTAAVTASRRRSSAAFGFFRRGSKA